MTAAAVWCAVEDLRPWEGNYIVHPQKQLDTIRASIARNGWGSPCVALPNRRLIIGHGRVAAMRQLLDDDEVFAELAEIDPEEAARLRNGEVPVRFRDVPEDRAAELAVADNESARLGVRDDDALQRVLADLEQDSTQDMINRALGMEQAELDRLLQRAGVRPDPRTVPLPTPPPVPEAPDSVVGQIYQLGPHRLACGDSHDADLRAQLLDGVRVHAVIQDPPFAIYGSSTGLSSSVADDAMVRPFFAAMWRHTEGMLQLHGHAYVFCDWRSYPSLWATLKGTHMAPANLLVWDKKHPGLGSKWQNGHELVLFAELQAPQGTMRGSASSGCRLVMGKSNILRHSKPRGDERLHNAAKPRDLLAEIMEACTDQGQTVGDCYAGSGTVLLVSAQLGRVCRCFEKEPGWCDVIRKRWTAWAEAAGVDPGPGALR